MTVIKHLVTGALLIAYRDYTTETYLRGGLVSTIIYGMKIRVSEMLDDSGTTHFVHALVTRRPGHSHTTLGSISISHTCRDEVQMDTSPKLPNFRKPV